MKIPCDYSDHRRKCDSEAKIDNYDEIKADSITNRKQSSKQVKNDLKCKIQNDFQ